MGGVTGDKMKEETNVYLKRKKNARYFESQHVREEHDRKMITRIYTTEDRNAVGSYVIAGRAGIKILPMDFF